jgi:hypothetical protein
MAGFYNIHLRKTSDPTQISKTKIERGMVIKIKYKKSTQTKLYLVFVLQPKWPKNTEGKLHGLSLDNIPPNKLLEISKLYNEVVATSSTVKKLDLAKIKIDEASKSFYTKEIRTDKKLKEGYRTFNLLDIKSVEVLNYDWGKYDRVADRDERRRKIEEEARIRKEQDDALKGI